MPTAAASPTNAPLGYLSAERAARVDDRIREVPDLVVEVISPDSRGFDMKTKRVDYEAAGVTEYWLIDPQQRMMQFLVLTEGSYHEAQPDAGCYTSSALPGFKLDLARICKLF